MPNLPHDRQQIDPRLAQLLEAAVEQRLSGEQANQLEQLVQADAGARQLYVEYMHQHACLQWALMDKVDAQGSVSPAHPDQHRHPSPYRRQPSVPALVGYTLTTVALVLIAITATAIWFHQSQTGAGADERFATLTRTQHCQWDGGTLPTERGSKLGAGRLRLAQGLARIEFHNGAELTLQAPVDIELISEDRCLLRRGKIVGHMPPAAYGFTIETPLTTLVDRGTDFGVSVSQSGSTEVEVFQGQVDVLHQPTGTSAQLVTGQRSRSDSASMVLCPPQDAETGTSTETIQRLQPEQRGRYEMISTAFGRGQDAYVQSNVDNRPPADTLLLVKRSDRSDWHRKAYLGFDLSSLRGRQIRSAQLMLSAQPTGLGFAADLPAAEFVVYGVTDESLDQWDEQTMTWQTAPANRPEGGLNADATVRLGTVTIPPGVTDGTCVFESDELIDFLNRDTNAYATLIVLRSTKATQKGTLVHAFASHRHPTSAPPTLRVSFAQLRRN